MFTTLAAVLVALALGHVAPAAAASLRRFDGFRRWLGWLDARGGKAWQGPAGVAVANAVADATGVRLSDLPTTAPRVFAALRQRIASHNE